MRHRGELYARRHMARYGDDPRDKTERRMKHLYTTIPQVLVHESLSRFFPHYEMKSFHEIGPLDLQQRLEPEQNIWGEFPLAPDKRQAIDDYVALLLDFNRRSLEIAKRYMSS